MNFIFLNICGALNCHYQIVHENVQLGQLRLIPPGLGLLVLVVGYEVA